MILILFDSNLQNICLIIIIDTLNWLKIIDDFSVPQAQLLSFNYSQCIGSVSALTVQGRIVLILLRDHTEEQKHFCTPHPV